MPPGDATSTKSTFAEVNPDLLVWARETAAMTVEAAAKKIGVKPERLVLWEAGIRKPTVTQLRNAAHAYKRPLAVFFLPSPPARPEPLHDFRRFPGEDVPPPSSTAVFQMRRARRSRTVALELLSDRGETVPPFTLRASVNDDPERAAHRAREWLGVSLQEQAAWHDEYLALNRWIEEFEARNVLVFQASRVPLDEMRGFSFSESVLPVIVLNAADLPRARTFTLMHEFTHLMLNLGGVCDPQRVANRGRNPDESIEVFCNHVAGALLVPSRALIEHHILGEHPRMVEWSEAHIRELAQAFSVSREVILRRLLILGRTTEEFYEQKRQEYLAEYRRLAARREEEDDAGGFAPHFRIAVRNNGRRYTQLVLDALEAERITLADIPDYLGVRLKHLDDIANALRRRRVET
jgi:Zn-dependent peptidase ImmA (M78 family)